MQSLILNKFSDNKNFSIVTDRKEIVAIKSSQKVVSERFFSEKLNAVDGHFFPSFFKMLFYHNSSTQQYLLTKKNNGILSCV